MAGRTRVELINKRLPSQTYPLEVLEILLLFKKHLTSQPNFVEDDSNHLTGDTH